VCSKKFENANVLIALARIPELSKLVIFAIHVSCCWRLTFEEYQRFWKDGQRKARRRAGMLAYRAKSSDSSSVKSTRLDSCTQKLFGPVKQVKVGVKQDFKHN
jgi:hypothetical protein